MASESSEFRRRDAPAIVGKKAEEVIVVTPADSVPAQPAAAPVAASWTNADLAPIKGNPWRFEFGFDSHSLLDQHKGSLDTVAAYLRAHPQARLRIEGHTDNVGSSGYNAQLSKRRALAVQRYLLSLGIAPERTETGHFGYARPLESNAAEEGRARNRRVEIILLK